MKKVRWLVLAIFGAAVAQEMAKPASECTWHGELIGVVPYDLRRPTASRLRAAFWSPDDLRIFTPRTFGVGWSINIGRLVKLARRAPTRRDRRPTS